jgi:hypothetical protein
LTSVTWSAILRQPKQTPPARLSPSRRVPPSNGGDRQVLVILAAVDGEPVHLCGICGFPLSEPSEPCPRCALLDEDVAAAIDSRRTVADVEKWLKGQAKPHPLEAEIGKLQATLDALEVCLPLWWADKLLWRGQRWPLATRPLLYLSDSTAGR